MKKNKKLIPLDNSAKMYPLLMSKSFQNRFRVSFSLSTLVDEAVLQKSLEKLLELLPYFKVTLHSGFFWHYFKTIDTKPKIYSSLPCFLPIIDIKQNNGYLFYVSYNKNTISVDFFHALCDGTGGLTFVKFLLSIYNNLIKKEPIEDFNISKDDFFEDSFLSHYKKRFLFRLNIKDLKGRRANLIKGTFNDKKENVPFNYNFTLSSVGAASKEHHCSMTSLVVGAFVYALIMSSKKRTKRPYEIFIPINLRNIFHSKTMRNFSLFSRVCIDPKKHDLSLNSIIDITQACIRKDVKKEVLEDKISTTVRAEKFLPLRIMPLFLKKVIFYFSNFFFGRGKKTCTISNLGVVKLDSKIENLVDNIDFYLSTTPSAPISLTCLSYNQVFTVHFTSCIKETVVIDTFLKVLKDLNVETI